MMIDAEILNVSATLLKCNDDEVHEQAALLLGSFAISAIGRQLFECAFPNLMLRLKDENLAVRAASSWCLK